jgi:hypothetical protein
VLHLKTDLIFKLIPEDDAYNPALDLSNELRGWPEVAEKATELLAQMPENAFLASYHYTMCGQLAYATRHANRQTACLAPRRSAFDYIAPNTPLKGRDALLVTDSRYFRNPSEWATCGGGLHEAAQVSVTRAARVVRRFTLWRCDRYGEKAKAAPEPSVPVTKDESETVEKPDASPALVQPEPPLPTPPVATPVLSDPSTEPEAPSVSPDNDSPVLIPSQPDLASPPVMEL